MNRHQFGAVRKGRLDLHVMDHLGDAFHALRAADDMSTSLHHIRNRAPVARTLNHRIRDQRNRFGVVQLYAARQSFARHLGSHRHHQFVFFSRCHSPPP